MSEVQKTENTAPSLIEKSINDSTNDMWTYRRKRGKGYDKEEIPEIISCYV